LSTHPPGLDDFGEEPALRIQPNFADDDGSHAVTPGDLAVIYNLVPLYKKGITGGGQEVVVVGESALPLDDLRSFRNAAGLPV
jgi:subtilase family serine protease